jgi:hypothetical protein
LNPIVKIAILCLILASCSLQKRATRKITWLTEKGFITNSSDTVFVSDTIKGFTHDTVYYGDTFNNIDTFTLTKDNIISTTVVKWRERTIKETLMVRDTFKIYPKIVNNQTIKPPDTHSHWKFYLAIIAEGVVILGLLLAVWGLVVKRK